MGHVPHVYVGGPLDHEELGLSMAQRDHLDRVLKRKASSPISYTDGEGIIGKGIYEGGVVVRGAEREVARPSYLVIASAPPSSKERARFLVEKLAELGVAKLIWMRTVHGNRKAPASKKVRSWAESALEQSRGAWLMKVPEELASWDQLEAPVFVADPGATQPEGMQPQTVVIGPEGGWAEDELPEGIGRIGLGPTVLRVETAALVAAARFL